MVVLPLVNAVIVPAATDAATSGAVELTSRFAAYLLEGQLRQPSEWCWIHGNISTAIDGNFCHLDTIVVNRQVLFASLPEVAFNCQVEPVSVAESCSASVFFIPRQCRMLC